MVHGIKEREDKGYPKINKINKKIPSLPPTWANFKKIVC